MLYKRAVRSVLALGCLLLLVCSADAHEPFEITTNAKILASGSTLNILITDSTAAKICLPAASGVSRLGDVEFARDKALIDACAARLFTLSDGQQTLLPSSVETHLSPEKDLDATITYPPSATGVLLFDAVHLASLGDPIYGDTFTATSADKFLVQKLLLLEDSRVEIQLGHAQAPQQSSFSEFLRLGIEHILTGYDHLLFLAGLLVVCRTLRSTLMIITAFTLAHSLTLALAALKVVTIASAIVEPCIAATIVFVGVENIWRSRHQREFSGRWLLTFGFGLMHGFGFASALQSAGLPASGWELVKPLLAFNLGVEFGQLAVAAVFLPLLFWLQRFPWFTRWVLLPLSTLVVLAGSVWWVQRVFF